MKLVGEDLW